jgi:CubicO group peptidase (beta-lactamase class C family)
MTLRHGAVLALVGWYLILAPRTSDSFLLGGAGAACAQEPSSQSSTSQEFVATEDTSIKTPHGDPFKVPKDWRLQSRTEFVLLNAPEGDALLAIVHAGAAANATDAIKRAWAQVRPGADYPIRFDTPIGPRNGWRGRRQLTYETSPNEKRSRWAIAQQYHGDWSVILFDGSNATAEKRGSQVGLVLLSLTPKGYVRETFAGRTAHPLDAERIAILKKFVSDGMGRLGVPGVGLAFIDGGKVVYAGGLGVRQLGKNTPVDNNTLFIAASNTKAMSTLLMAHEVDAGRMRWDERATDVDPSFKLGDEATTRKVLMKYLVCACTGMPREDMEWLFSSSKATPEDSIESLARMQPTSAFGSLFQYSNVMVSTGGYLAASLEDPKRELGAAYDDAMQRIVFEPLGMVHTTFSFEQALRGNHASPHDTDADGIVRIADMGLNRTVIPLRPAGGMWTSSGDLIRYVQMELANGKLPNGQQLVSETNLLERRKPQVLIADKMYYGMGLMTDDTMGIQVIHHGGDLLGYHSDMMWLPAYNVGAVILTNAGRGVFLRGPLLRRLEEVLFDGESLASEQLEASAAANDAEIVATRKRLVIPADTQAAAGLRHSYRNAALGVIEVERHGKRVSFRFPQWHSEVATRKNDDGTVSFITIDPGVDGFEFVVGGTQNEPTLTLRDEQHEYVFSGKPGIPRMTARSDTIGMTKQ